MLIDRYYQTIEGLIDTVKATQKAKCIEAGKLIAESVAGGGCVHVYDKGHIIDSELIERGGGLMLLKPLKYKLEVDNPVRTRDRSEVDTSMEGLAKYVLKASGVKAGDVLIIGSVSGKTADTIDLALEAKQWGVHVVALTSLSYSTQVASEHSSGKRLFECADIVLDNCAPAGEGMMAVEGLEAHLCAASGLSAAIIMWSVTTVVVEELLNKGITPSVFKSHNFEGGPKFNLNLRAIYAEKGI